MKKKQNYLQPGLHVCAHRTRAVLMASAGGSGEGYTSEAGGYGNNSGEGLTTEEGQW